MKNLPSIEHEGVRIARDTPRSANGTYLWTDLVGAVQTAISEERKRHPDLRLAMDEYRESMEKGFLHQYDPEITEYLKDVVGVVEANSFEKGELYDRYAKEAEGYSDRGQSHRKKWESSNSGRGWEIGKLAGFPIAVSCYIDVIDGHRILFLDTSSTVVHHDLVDRWLMNVLPASAFRDNGYLNKVDANNFHNVFPRSS